MSNHRIKKPYTFTLTPVCAEKLAIFCEKEELTKSRVVELAIKYLLKKIADKSISIDDRDPFIINTNIKL